MSKIHDIPLKAKMEPIPKYLLGSWVMALFLEVMLCVTIKTEARVLVSHL